MLRRLRALLPEQHPTTKLLLGLCVALFAVMALDTFQHFNPPDPFSAFLFSPPIPLLLRWGAHVRGELEWWRVIMSTVVHIGLIHLIFNMSALRDVGRAVENWYGSAVALFAFALTGVGAAAASNVLGGLPLPDTGGLWWLLAKVQGGKGVAAGASGGLMGLIGVMSVAGHRSGHALGRAIRDAMLRWAFLALLLGVALGFDNIAHGFGFILGAGLAFALPTPAALQRPTPSTHALKLALVALSLSIFGLGVAGLIRSNLNQRVKDACLNAPSRPDDLPDALSTCHDALARLPTDPDLLDRTAALLLRQGSPDSRDAATRLYADALPHLADMRRIQLGQLSFDRCVSFLSSLQRHDDPSSPSSPRPSDADATPDALDPRHVFFCAQATIILPQDPAPYNNLIIAYTWIGQPDKVAEVCAAAARSLPASASPSTNLRRACPDL